MASRKGWHGESRRHSLARRGIKTGPRVNLHGKKYRYNEYFTQLKEDGKTVGFARNKPINRNVMQSDTNNERFYCLVYDKNTANDIASQLRKKGVDAKVEVDRTAKSEDNGGLSIYDVVINYPGDKLLYADKSGNTLWEKKTGINRKQIYAKNNEGELVDFDGVAELTKKSGVYKDKYLEPTSDKGKKFLVKQK